MIFLGTTLILFSPTANAEDYPLWPPLDFTSGKDEVFEFNFGGTNSASFAISSGNTDGKYGNFEYAPPSGYYALCTKRLAEFG